MGLKSEICRTRLLGRYDTNVAKTGCLDYSFTTNFDGSNTIYDVRCLLIISVNVKFLLNL